MPFCFGLSAMTGFKLGKESSFRFLDQAELFPFGISSGFRFPPTAIAVFLNVAGLPLQSDDRFAAVREFPFRSRRSVLINSVRHCEAGRALLSLLRLHAHAGAQTHAHSPSAPEVPPVVVSVLQRGVALQVPIGGASLQRHVVWLLLPPFPGGFNFGPPAFELGLGLS